VLLVLDTCEHLLGAGPLLAELLERCPRLALLVTSRTVLRLRGEQRFTVPPLAMPAVQPATDDADGLAVAEAPPTSRNGLQPL
jgi:predicted ATPase